MVQRGKIRAVKQIETEVCKFRNLEEVWFERFIAALDHPRTHFAHLTLAKRGVSPLPRVIGCDSMRDIEARFRRIKILEASEVC